MQVKANNHFCYAVSHVENYHNNDYNQDNDDKHHACHTTSIDNYNYSDYHSFFNHSTIDNYRLAGNSLR